MTVRLPCIAARYTDSFSDIRRRRLFIRLDSIDAMNRWLDIRPSPCLHRFVDVFPAGYFQRMRWKIRPFFFGIYPFNSVAAESHAILLPRAGEGGPKGRMRAGSPNHSPHPTPGAPPRFCTAETGASPVHGRGAYSRCVHLRVCPFMSGLRVIAFFAPRFDAHGHCDGRNRPSKKESTKKLEPSPHRCHSTLGCTMHLTFKPQSE